MPLKPKASADLMAFMAQQRARVQQAPQIDIENFYPVGQGFCGIWDGGGGNFRGFLTHSLAPCVGLAIVLPRFVALSHLDSDFLQSGPGGRAIGQITQLFGMMSLAQIQQARIYIYADRAGDITSRQVGAQLRRHMLAYVEDNHIEWRDKGCSGFMSVRFDNNDVVMCPDGPLNNLPALSNVAEDNSNIHHLSMYL